MQVILQKDVPKLGSLGDLVDVADGYGRNYLIPRGFAVAAHAGNIRRLEHDQSRIRAEKDRLVEAAQARAKSLEGLAITLKRKAAEDGEKLFGAVTNRDIASALEAEGVEVDRRAIDLPEPIRAIGVYEVPIRLFAEVTASVKVYVIQE
jgi:large subunit ribosomal protein L9